MNSEFAQCMLASISRINPTGRLDDDLPVGIPHRMFFEAIEKGEASAVALYVELWPEALYSIRPEHFERGEILEILVARFLSIIDDVTVLVDALQAKVRPISDIFLHSTDDDHSMDVGTHPAVEERPTTPVIELDPYLIYEKLFDRFVTSLFLYNAGRTNRHPALVGVEQITTYVNEHFFSHRPTSNAAVDWSNIIDPVKRDIESRRFLILPTFGGGYLSVVRHPCLYHPPYAKRVEGGRSFRTEMRQSTRWLKTIRSSLFLAHVPFHTGPLHHAPNPVDDELFDLFVALIDRARSRPNYAILRDPQMTTEEVYHPTGLEAVMGNTLIVELAKKIGESPESIRHIDRIRTIGDPITATLAAAFFFPRFEVPIGPTTHSAIDPSTSKAAKEDELIDRSINDYAVHTYMRQIPHILDLEPVSGSIYAASSTTVSSTTVSSTTSGEVAPDQWGSTRRLSRIALAHLLHHDTEKYSVNDIVLPPLHDTRADLLDYGDQQHRYSCLSRAPKRELLEGVVEETDFLLHRAAFVRLIGSIEKIIRKADRYEIQTGGSTEFKTLVEKIVRGGYALRWHFATIALRYVHPIVFDLLVDDYIPNDASIRAEALLAARASKEPNDPPKTRIVPYIPFDPLERGVFSRADRVYRQPAWCLAQSKTQSIDGRSFDEILGFWHYPELAEAFAAAYKASPTSAVLYWNRFKDMGVADNVARFETRDRVDSETELLFYIDLYNSTYGMNPMTSTKPETLLDVILEGMFRLRSLRAARRLIVPIHIDRRPVHLQRDVVRRGKKVRFDDDSDDDGAGEEVVQSKEEIDREYINVMPDEELLVRLLRKVIAWNRPVLRYSRPGHVFADTPLHPPPEDVQPTHPMSRGRTAAEGRGKRRREDRATIERYEPPKSIELGASIAERSMLFFIEMLRHYRSVRGKPLLIPYVDQVFDMFAFAYGVIPKNPLHPVRQQGVYYPRPFSLDPIERRIAIEMRIDEYARHSPFSREEVGKRLSILRSPSALLIYPDLDDEPGVQYASTEVDARLVDVPVGGRFSHPIPRTNEELRRPAMLLRPIDIRICTDLGFIEAIGETGMMEGYF